MNPQNQNLALYIHWPFCQKKCPYCDFNSHVRDDIDEQAMFQAYQQDFLASLKWWGEARPNISSIFFGGGTPSLMGANLVEKLLIMISNHANFCDDIEITLEANPSSFEMAKFEDFKLAGMNRLSLGIQSFDDDILRFLGRVHDAKMAIEAIEVGHRLFDRLSFDLIYGIRGMDNQKWQAALAKALSLAGDHISLYQLTIEPGTNFMTRHKKGEALTLNEKDAAYQYEQTLDYWASHGMPAYEISNFARYTASNKDHRAKHNLAYWRYLPYLGIGPGAHSRMMKKGKTLALNKTRLPETWLKQTEDGGFNDFCHQESLTDEQLYMEILLMGLRLFEGLPESRLQNHSRLGFNHLNQDRLNHFIQIGWLTLTNKSQNDRLLTITRQGALRLDGILSALIQ